MTFQSPIRLFVHVEEPSMRETIETLLPRLVQRSDVEHRVIDHGSKHALLDAVPNRLRGYANWPEPALRVLILVDRDDDECVALKLRLEQAAVSAGLSTKTNSDTGGQFTVVNRVVIEELESWFLGDVPAIVAAYPGVSPTLGATAKFRNPDAVAGGTWEALFRVLKQAGYYTGLERMPKMEVARRIAPLMNASHNRSASFEAFRTGLAALLMV